MPARLTKIEPRQITFCYLLMTSVDVKFGGAWRVLDQQQEQHKAVITELCRQVRLQGQLYMLTFDRKLEVPAGLREPAPDAAADLFANVARGAVPELRSAATSAPKSCRRQR